MSFSTVRSSSSSSSSTASAAGAEAAPDHRAVRSLPLSLPSGAHDSAQWTRDLMATTHGALHGKVILVSGVGPGLGRAVASEALRAGARVVLGDLDGARVRAILSDLGADEDAALAVEADIRSLAACEELVSAARSAFGRVDGLVHVAALDTPVGGLLDGDLDDWSAVAEVNVKGTLQLTKLAVPLLRDSGAGSVVIVGSIAAAGPVEGV